MFLSHKLSRIFFSAIVAILLILFMVIYWYSVTLINQEVYRTERNTSRIILNNVYQLANKMDANLITYRQDAILAHQKSLRTAIDLAASHISSALEQAKLDNRSDDQTFAQIFKELRNFRYGDNNYIWLANTESVLLSHPEAIYHGVNALEIKNKDGQGVIATVIAKALNDGEGFYQYSWQRLGSTETVDKMSYVKYFPQWQLLIGSGLYLDQLEQEVSARRATLLEQFRLTLSDIVIAKTGYLFVFDQQGNMLFHPNPNIYATNALLLKNPQSQQSILQELKAVADTGKELTYQWDRPNDPNNYVYEKLSLVRYLPSLGWYICSSVYVDELKNSGRLLSQQIIIIGIIALLFAIAIVYFFTGWITKPISRLAQVAQKVSQGDLTLTSGISRPDELGVLARSFDEMVSQLRDNIATLDHKVARRTKALKQSNQQLTQAQRMNAVGQLAGGLAHDFNNLLTIILGNLASAQQQFPDNAPLLKRLEPAIRASKRANEITNRLLAFSRRQSLMPSWFNVAQLIDDTVELVKGSLPSAVNVTCHYSSRDLQLFLDASLLENCLINLMFNAKDAMPNGGEISLDVTHQVVTSTLSLDEVVTPGNYIEIKITDTGCGFDEGAIKQAFEPFFTTKATGMGSGLGLSMVFGFVKQSQGYINIENAKERGAIITLLLPLIEPVKVTTVVPSLVDYPLNNRLILLVEDDDDVRALVREQLISFNFNVIDAVDADEAAQLINNITGLYGMVSDVRMPGALDGFQLADLLLTHSPHSKVVLMSGYAYNDDSLSHPLINYPLLLKPFSPNALLQALKK